MEYYSAIQKKQIIKWMKLKTIILSIVILGYMLK